jgi:hypothetical protein
LTAQDRQRAVVSAARQLDFNRLSHFDTAESFCPSKGRANDAQFTVSSR